VALETASQSEQALLERCRSNGLDVGPMPISLAACEQVNAGGEAGGRAHQDNTDKRRICNHNAWFRVNIYMYLSVLDDKHPCVVFFLHFNTEK
jgi:hypothetical protein